MSTDQKTGFFKRLRAKLNPPNSWLSYDLGNLFKGRKIDAAILEELETRLLGADVGVTVTEELLEKLRRRVARNELADVEALMTALKESIAAILQPVAKPLVVDRTQKPFVILVVGVNGSGKTTTIGKLARRLVAEKRGVLLAAGDTFRAAAIEQLGIWAQRAGVEVVAQQAGADPGAVVFDALQAAKTRGIDVLIADTAGRLHSQSHLMEELKKVRSACCARRPGRAARGAAGARCQPGPERAVAGGAVPRGDRRHRPRADQARRHRAGGIVLAIARRSACRSASSASASRPRTSASSTPRRSRARWSTARARRGRRRVIVFDRVSKRYPNGREALRTSRCASRPARWCS
jgi:energy-coupling factor transporter ATP-binding protein EcfA2